jgi:RNA polymerase sigma factor, sigma-70 family
VRAQKKLSANEIERRLVDDAQNPDAWETAIKVGPSRAPRPAWYRQTVVADRRENGVENVRLHYGPVPKADRDREEQALQRKRLYDAIAELPEGQRQSFQLWVDGFKYREISVVLGISVSAVKSRLSDARNHLRSRLKDSEREVSASAAKH